MESSLAMRWDAKAASDLWGMQLDSFLISVTAESACERAVEVGGEEEEDSKGKGNELPGRMMPRFRT